MKKIMMAAVAASMLAAPAFAAATAGSQVSHSILLNAEVDAYCAIGGAATANVGDLVNSEAFLVADAQAKILAALNTTNTRAWCNGTRNSINVTRTPLARVASADINVDTAALGNAGFAQAILFDVGVAIEGAVRTGSFSQLEESSDGVGAYGVGEISAFGPVGSSLVTFEASTYTGASGLTDGPDLVITGSKTSEGPTASFTLADPASRRLLAGDYTGTVKVTLIPGV